MIYCHVGMQQLFKIENYELLGLGDNGTCDAFEHYIGT